MAQRSLSTDVRSVAGLNLVRGPLPPIGRGRRADHPREQARYPAPRACATSPHDHGDASELSAAHIFSLSLSPPIAKTLGKERRDGRPGGRARLQGASRRGGGVALRPPHPSPTARGGQRIGTTEAISPRPHRSGGGGGCWQLPLPGLTHSRQRGAPISRAYGSRTTGQESTQITSIADRLLAIIADNIQVESIKAILHYRSGGISLIFGWTHA
eukprot:2236441-Pleurochrysis_carterae.AAC.2